MTRNCWSIYDITCVFDQLLLLTSMFYGILMAITAIYMYIAYADDIILYQSG